MTIGEAFGDAVRELRHERGDSQETIAYRIGLDRSYLSELENGHKAPSLKTVFRLAEALSVEPEILVSRVGEKMQSENEAIS